MHLGLRGVGAGHGQGGEGGDARGILGVHAPPENSVEDGQGCRLQQAGHDLDRHDLGQGTQRASGLDELKPQGPDAVRVLGDQRPVLRLAGQTAEQPVALDAAPEMHLEPRQGGQWLLRFRCRVAHDADDVGNALAGPISDRRDQLLSGGEVAVDRAPREVSCRRDGVEAGVRIREERRERGIEEGVSVDLRIAPAPVLTVLHPAQARNMHTCVQVAISGPRPTLRAIVAPLA
jgi:hypothetical protein